MDTQATQHACYLHGGMAVEEEAVECVRVDGSPREIERFSKHLQQPKQTKTQSAPQIVGDSHIR